MTTERKSPMDCLRALRADYETWKLVKQFASGDKTVWPLRDFAEGRLRSLRIQMLAQVKHMKETAAAIANKTPVEMLATSDATKDAMLRLGLYVYGRELVLFKPGSTTAAPSKERRKAMKK